MTQRLRHAHSLVLAGPRHDSRAFALPMVALMSVVVGLLAAMMIERQGAQTRLVQRQITSYRDDHLARGLEEIVDSWLKGVAHRPLRERLDPDGKALEMELDGGIKLSVYVFDAQGTVLTDLGGLAGESMQDARGILSELRHSASAARLRSPPPLTRKRGPVRVSALTAPDEVLRAAVTYATGGDKADAFIAAILRGQSSGKMTNEDLIQFQNEASVSAAARPVIQRVLTTEPTLWRLDAKITRTNPGPFERASATYTGLAILDRGASRAAAKDRDGVERLGNILEWHRVPD